MKWLGWAICVLGLWILLGAFISNIVIPIVCGILIAVLGLMAAMKG